MKQPDNKGSQQGRTKKPQRKFTSHIDGELRSESADWGVFKLSHAAKISKSMASAEAKAFWIDLWSIMGHKSLSAGYLVDDDGNPLSIGEIACSIGARPTTAQKRIDELLKHGIFKQVAGVIFDPFLVGEAKRQAKRRENRGNPDGFSIEIDKIRKKVSRAHTSQVPQSEGDNTETHHNDNSHKDTDQDRDTDRDRRSVPSNTSTAPSSTPSPSGGVSESLPNDGKANSRHGAGSVPPSDEPTKDTGSVHAEPKPAPAEPKRKNLSQDQFLALCGRTLLEMPAGDEFSGRRWMESRFQGVSVSGSHVGAGVDFSIVCFGSDMQYGGTKWLLENPKYWQTFHIEEESELKDKLVRAMEVIQKYEADYQEKAA